jgi:class 3 adenylate cyclase/TolB-like protein
MGTERLPRKLAAVLYADVAGYSRLTGADEDTTHQRLRDRLDVFAARIKHHRGQVMHYAGDAVLARFEAAVDAVSCAIDVQRELARRSAGLRADQRVEFRIGVNLGDVIDDCGDVYGDGVNVAARLESLAGPGEICVAEAVRTAIGKRLPLEYEDLGEPALKNIDHPVRAYRLRFPAETSDDDMASPLIELAGRIARSKLGTATIAAFLVAIGVAGLGTYSQYTSPTAGACEPGPASAPNKSVAVLPFADLTEGGQQTWFTDGIAEEVLNSLAQLPELFVTARTSSFQFRDQTLCVGAIAARLGVANVLEGSVRSNRDKIRVTAQLIRASDGFHLWSNDYDGTTSNLFDFQRDVADHVAAALDVILDETARARMFESGTRNVEAFREYKEGWRIYNLAHMRGAKQTLWDANRHFDRALELDPHYAQAAVGRSDAFVHLLITPRADYVANSPYTQQEALELLLRNLDFIVLESKAATLKLATSVYRDSFTRDWSRLPSLLAQLREQWDVSAFQFGEGIDSALWLPSILWLNRQDDLVRALAEHQVARDPLSGAAWYRLHEVEVRTGHLDVAREVLRKARAHLGPSALRDREAEMALRQGDRAKLLEMLTQASSQPTMVIAALRGDYPTAKRLADERVIAFADPPGTDWSDALGTYYEIGAAESARALVKRIDDSLAGTAIFVQWIGNNPLFFDPNDAPNFMAKLKQADIDPASFARMPRLSTLP